MVDTSLSIISFPYKVEAIWDDDIHVSGIHFILNDNADSIKQECNRLAGYGIDGPCTFFKIWNTNDESIYLEIDNQSVKVGTHYA